MKRGLEWPLGIAAVLGLSVAGQVWFAVVASRDQSFAVERDYYQKALHWDREIAQRQANVHLGWTLTPTLRLGGGSAATEGMVSVELHDALGGAITGAKVEVLAMHNARAARQLTATLSEVGAGTYRADLAAQRPGEWELRFTVRRGAEQFTVNERVDAVRVN